MELQRSAGSELHPSDHHQRFVSNLMSVYITSCGFDWLMYKRKAKQFYFVCTSEEELKHFTAFHKPIVFFITLLASLVGLHFQVLGISPLKKHFTIILLFIMDIIVYTIAYMRINLQPHNKEYLPILWWIWRDLARHIVSNWRRTRGRCGKNRNDHFSSGRHVPHGDG